jgi:hypothetical protein
MLKKTVQPRMVRMKSCVTIESDVTPPASIPIHAIARRLP